MENASWLGPTSARVFATTRWTVIAACRQDDETRAREALAELCQTYWRPVYLRIRHHGYAAHDAQDLTQDFFLHLLEGKWLDQLDEVKGRFRAYLATTLQNFLRKQWRRRWTLRRGRGCDLLQIEAADAEESYALALATQTTPESLYEREWACVVVNQTLQQLRIEMRAAGREFLFDHFEAILGAETRNFRFEQLADALNLSVGALHGTLHRWRHRYYTLMREEIARTVVSKSDIEDELRHLRRVFSRPA